MKITDVKLRFAKHYLFVQVYTDAGIVGLGEAFRKLLAGSELIERHKEHVQDPDRKSTRLNSSH